MVTSAKQNREKYLGLVKEGIKRRIYFLKYKIKDPILDFVKKNSEDHKEKVIKTVVAISKVDNNSYIIFHHPNWLGVTSATKEEFINNIPLEEIYNKEDIKKIVDIIKEKDIKQVIFSAFNTGWDELAKEIKKEDKNIKLKVFWHGSNSQIIENDNWRYNKSFIELHKQGIIDVIATCKESLYNFYKSRGFNVCFVMNTVRVNNKEEYVSDKYTENKIGLYAAGNDWRKNMYTQILAASDIENVTLDMLPITESAKILTSYLGINVTGETKHVKRDELLKRMAQNEINIYVTFSECAPMLPIESLEVGVPCITGNNHHYFKGHELEKYLVVNREDDALEIASKIRLCIKNRDKIMKLYQIWKIDYDKLSIKSVEDFLNK